MSPRYGLEPIRRHPNRGFGKSLEISELNKFHILISLASQTRFHGTDRFQDQNGKGLMTRCLSV